MAIIKDNSLKNFLDGEFANSGSGNSSSRNNLESGTTLEAVSYTHLRAHET